MEKTSHLLQCARSEAIKLVQLKYEDELELVLTKHKTDPRLLQVFKNILKLHSIKSPLNTTTVGISVSLPLLQQAFWEQATIGWNNFVLG